MNSSTTATLAELFKPAGAHRQGGPGRAAVRNQALEKDPIAQHLLAHCEHGPVTSSGALPIKCPFESEHSDRDEPGRLGTGTVYFPRATGGYTTGRFVCAHSHCDPERVDDHGRKIRTQQHFLDAIGFEPRLADFEDLGAGGAIPADDLPADIQELVSDPDVQAAWAELSGAVEAMALVHGSEHVAGLLRQANGMHSGAGMVLLFQPGGKRRRFEPVDVENVDLPPPSWIIEDVLPEAELAMIYGPTKAGKTFITIDLVASIAAGVAWRGKEVKQGRVVYVPAEDARGVKARVDAWKAHHGVQFAPGQFQMILDDPNFVQAADPKLMAEVIREGGTVRVIVIDTLARISPGVDENSTKDMGLIVQRCAMLSRLTGALVLLIHHAGKNVDAGARGSSAIPAALDGEYLVTGDKRGRTLKVTKLKNAEDGDQYHFKVLSLDGIGVAIPAEGKGAGRTTRKGRNGRQQKVCDLASDMLMDGRPVAYDKLLAAVVDSIPADPGKVDNRRRDARVAIGWLSDHGYLTFQDNVLVAVADG
jgi:hypothetical protein